MEKPILFSSPMVRAILSGKKTQTRRVIKAPSWSKPENAGVDFGCYACSMLLWVRETFTGDEWCGHAYKADGTKLPIDCGEVVFSKWKPSIFMPRNVSRITLEVTDVRVERLQDITEADAMAEGFQNRMAFKDLWNALNEKRGFGWDKNPWVYALEFKRVKP